MVIVMMRAPPLLPTIAALACRHHGRPRTTRTPMTMTMSQRAAQAVAAAAAAASLLLSPR